jgi:hypothetical protein
VPANIADRNCQNTVKNTAFLLQQSVYLPCQPTVIANSCFTWQLLEEETNRKKIVNAYQRTSMKTQA